MKVIHMGTPSEKLVGTLQPFLDLTAQFVWFPAREPKVMVPSLGCLLGFQVDQINLNELLDQIMMTKSSWSD